MYESAGFQAYIFLESIENEYIFFLLSVRILFHCAFVQNPLILSFSRNSSFFYIFIIICVL